MIEEYVSVRGARRDYGVIITGSGAERKVDAAATLTLRESLRSKRK